MKKLFSSHDWIVNYFYLRISFTTNLLLDGENSNKHDKREENNSYDVIFRSLLYIG